MSEIVVAVVVESEADFRTATEIAERIVAEKHEWIEPFLPTIGTLEDPADSVLQWRGLEAGTSFSRWDKTADIYAQARQNGIRVPRFPRGQDKDKKSDYDSVAARKVMTYLLKLQEKMPVDAVVLIRDVDSQPQRHASLTQVRDAFAAENVVMVVGTADAKREAWVLNGFVAADEREQARLDTLTKTLTFDPCLAAERLRATDKGDARNVKTVLDTLTENSFEREAACWRETPLDMLRERGEKTGLTAYMQEVEDRLPPLLMAKG